MNDQHMYDLSAPTQPDHLADLTGEIRSPARVAFTEEQLAAVKPIAVSPHFADALAGSEAFHRALTERITPESNAAAYEAQLSVLGAEAVGEVIFTQAAEAVHTIASVDKPVRPTALPGSRIDPYGDRFPWGPIIEVYQAGPYTVLEFLEDVSKYDDPAVWVRHGRTLYYVFVDGKDTHTSAPSLEGALVAGIAYHLEGPNSRAADYFMRMVGGV